MQDYSPDGVCMIVSTSTDAANEMKAKKCR